MGSTLEYALTRKRRCRKVVWLTATVALVGFALLWEGASMRFPAPGFPRQAELSYAKSVSTRAPLHTSIGVECINSVQGHRLDAPSSVKARNVRTTRVILLSPRVGEAPPTKRELQGWLRPGWHTLLVEHPLSPFEADYLEMLETFTTKHGVDALVHDPVAHKYDPATFAFLPGAAQGCLSSTGYAGIIYASSHDVETILYVREYAGRHLEEDYPRYFLPFQLLPVLDLAARTDVNSDSVAGTAEQDLAAQSILLHHFIPDASKAVHLSGAPGLKLCTVPTRPMLQYGLCQPDDAQSHASQSAATSPYMLEEVPIAIVRPHHPSLPQEKKRNVLAHRPAFWALAFAMLEHELWVSRTSQPLDGAALRHVTRDTEARELGAALQHTAHCALAQLGFDVGTLPPAALCGDPPHLRSVADRATQAYPDYAVPHVEHGVQVNLSSMMRNELASLAPSRAYGPKPRVPVRLDAIPRFDRSHMFSPQIPHAANASVLAAALNRCSQRARGGILHETSLPWDTVLSSVLNDMFSTGYQLSLPRPQELDARALKTCFVSSEKVRDVALAVGCQSVQDYLVRNVWHANHTAWTINFVIPALKDHYADAFPVMRFYSKGPDIPDLNVEYCNSNEPGGTSGHVVQRCTAQGLRASFGHLSMIWAADDALLGFWNFYRYDLRRIWARAPRTFHEQPFHTPLGNGWAGHPEFGKPKILALQLNGTFLPEELRMRDANMRAGGNVSSSLIDSITIPRGVFERFAAISDALADAAVILEVALPSTITLLGWAPERLVTKCVYFWGDDRNRFAELWRAEADWVHAVKLSNPATRDFIRQIRSNITAMPDRYADLRFRALGPTALDCA